jgi:hypothetical protein
LRITAGVILFGALAGLVVVALGDRIVGNVQRLLGEFSAPRSAPSPTPTLAEPSPPAPAPGRDGPIAGVSARALNSCAPGGVCTIRILVEVRPAAEPLRVEWSYQIVDRCTGARTDWPGGAGVVIPGNDRLVGVEHVELPQARSLAVYPVTSGPERVSGPPLVVPPDGAGC